MRRVRTAYAIALVLLGLFVCLEGGYLFFSHLRGASEAVLLQKQDRSFTEERTVWKDEISAKGGAASWELFKKIYGGTDVRNAHERAHIFGEVLFDTEGVRGVAACDSSFSFGCYHSFFGKAISILGLPVIAELDRACIARWGEKGLGCQHGIGHGILWYLDASHLTEALRLCSTLSWKGPIGGCTSGVFMEYNFHTMADPRLSEVRPLEAARPYAPCDMVPKRFEQACYFEQPQWWNQVLGHDYARLGAYCGAVSDTLSREACFRGFGSIAASDAEYDVGASIAICNYMPGAHNVHLCLQGASWGFGSQPDFKAHAAEVCASLFKKDRVTCDTGADIFHDRAMVEI